LHPGGAAESKGHDDDTDSLHSLVFNVLEEGDAIQITSHSPMLLQQADHWSELTDPSRPSNGFESRSVPTTPRQCRLARHTSSNCNSVSEIFADAAAITKAVASQLDAAGEDEELDIECATGKQLCAPTQIKRARSLDVMIDIAERESKQGLLMY
jgi:hypothetical protein